LACGIVQKQGGPCGVLAAVQAFLLKNLIYSEESRASKKDALSLLSASSSDLQRALASAMADMLWKAGSERSACVALTGSQSASSGSGRYAYRGDGLTERLMLYTFHSYQDLKSFLFSQINLFMNPMGPGCVLFLYSALLSRGLDAIDGDMDDTSASMIGAHGYCTQELVNLLLTGRASSNVFDGVQELDGSTFKGITQRATVGFLTLFEHYGNMKVGENLKNPEFPIWVLCSESHYSTLWSLQRHSSASRGKFDLYYYDELANQDEEIRLTLDTTQPGHAERSSLEPPINDCIRTKWGPGTRIDWNGVEPIL